MGIKYVIKGILFLFSTVGSWEYLNRKLRVDILFLPSITIALQTTILFCAGIFNCLKEVTILLWAAGLLAFAYCSYKDKGISFIKKYFTAGYLFLAVSMALLFLFLRGKIYTHFDNFTHWGLVLRTMLETNRFPTFKDTIILFQQYPLGSATYLYYFAKLIRRTESFQMLGQCYMMLSCIMPAFYFCRKNKWAGMAVILFSANFFLTYNVVITNLLVDTLLPIVACCMFLYLFLYCREPGNSRAYYMLSVYLVQIIQIKNSGLLFVAVAAAILLYKAFREKMFVPAGTVILSPLLSFYLWRQHCSYVYEKSGTTFHAMTFSYFKKILGEKSLGSILTVMKALLKYFFTCKEIWIAMGILACSILLIRLLKPEFLKESIQVVRFSLVLYILYCIGLVLMYIFSMPEYEASYLAGIDRYMRTILIMIIYAGLVLNVKLISELEEKKVQAGAVVIIFIAFLAAESFAAYGKVRTVFEFYGAAPDKRIWLESRKDEYDVPSGDSYCILIQEYDSGYTYYLSRYVFRSNNVDVKIIEDKSQLDEIQAHYLFNYGGENEVIIEWLNENYPEQAENAVIILNNE